MKNTWKLLNEVINRKMKQRNFISHFNYNNNEIYDKQEIANGFNDFLVNIGPELANKNVIPENNDVLQYINDRNVNSMFLHGVNKNDVIKSFANKTSTDYNGMNMFILKKKLTLLLILFYMYVIYHFQRVCFPIARVISHYSNQGTSSCLLILIIDLCHLYLSFVRFLKNYLIIDLIDLLKKMYLE